MSDLVNITDEDVLRKMWFQTEDFCRKRDIRTCMYKLREERLKDLYKATDSGITNMDNGKMKTPSHSDSLANQSFESLKSKEIRDSESPTRDLKYAAARPDRGGWNVVTVSESTPDGNQQKKHTIATTQGTNDIPGGGKSSYAGLKENLTTHSHHGDAKNYTTTSGKLINSSLQENTVTGDDNCKRFESSTSSHQLTSSVTKSKFVGDINNPMSDQHRAAKDKFNQILNTTTEAMNKHANMEATVNNQHNEYSTKNTTATATKQINQNNQNNQTNRSNNEQSNMQLTQTEQQHHHNTNLTNLKQSMESGIPMRTDDMNEVEYLRTLPGKITSRQVEYPNANTKKIVETKTLDDGTVVKTTRYETKVEMGSKTLNELTTGNGKRTMAQQMSSNGTLIGDRAVLKRTEYYCSEADDDQSSTTSSQRRSDDSTTKSSTTITKDSQSDSRRESNTNINTNSKTNTTNRYTSQESSTRHASSSDRYRNNNTNEFIQNERNDTRAGQYRAPSTDRAAPHDTSRAPGQQNRPDNERGYPQDRQEAAPGQYRPATSGARDSPRSSGQPDHGYPAAPGGKNAPLSSAGPGQNRPADGDYPGRGEPRDSTPRPAGDRKDTDYPRSGQMPSAPYRPSPEKSTTKTVDNKKDTQKTSSTSSSTTSSTNYATNKSEFVSKRISVDLDATHEAFARSLRCVSPIEERRGGTPRSTRTPSQSSIRSISSSIRDRDRGRRSPSRESATYSESSRISSNTVTRSRNDVTKPALDQRRPTVGTPTAKRPQTSTPAQKPTDVRRTSTRRDTSDSIDITTSEVNKLKSRVTAGARPASTGRTPVQPTRPGRDSSSPAVVSRTVIKTATPQMRGASPAKTPNRPGSQEPVGRSRPQPASTVPRNTTGRDGSPNTQPRDSSPGSRDVSPMSDKLRRTSPDDTQPRDNGQPVDDDVASLKKPARKTSPGNDRPSDSTEPGYARPRGTTSPRDASKSPRRTSPGKDRPSDDVRRPGDSTEPGYARPRGTTSPRDASKSPRRTTPGNDRPSDSTEPGYARPRGTTSPRDASKSPRRTTPGNDRPSDSTEPGYARPRGTTSPRDASKSPRRTSPGKDRPSDDVRRPGDSTEPGYARPRGTTSPRDASKSPRRTTPGNDRPSDSTEPGYARPRGTTSPRDASKSPHRTSPGKDRPSDDVRRPGDSTEPGYARPRGTTSPRDASKSPRRTSPGNDRPSDSTEPGYARPRGTTSPRDASKSPRRTTPGNDRPSDSTEPGYVRPRGTTSPRDASKSPRRTSPGKDRPLPRGTSPHLERLSKSPSPTRSSHAVSSFTEEKRFESNQTLRTVTDITRNQGKVTTLGIEEPKRRPVKKRGPRPTSGGSYPSESPVGSESDEDDEISVDITVEGAIDDSIDITTTIDHTKKRDQIVLNSQSTDDFLLHERCSNDTVTKRNQKTVRNSTEREEEFRRDSLDVDDLEPRPKTTKAPQVSKKIVDDEYLITDTKTSKQTKDTKQEYANVRRVKSSQPNDRSDDEDVDKDDDDEGLPHEQPDEQPDESTRRRPAEPNRGPNRPSTQGDRRPVPSTDAGDEPESPSANHPDDKKRPNLARSETYEERCMKILGMDKNAIKETAEKNITDILSAIEQETMTTTSEVAKHFETKTNRIKETIDFLVSERQPVDRKPKSGSPDEPKSFFLQSPSDDEEDETKPRTVDSTGKPTLRPTQKSSPRTHTSPDRKPASADRKPASPDRKPASADRKPASPERKPASADRKPASPERKPVDDAPTGRRPERDNVSPAQIRKPARPSGEDSSPERSSPERRTAAKKPTTIGSAEPLKRKPTQSPERRQPNRNVSPTHRTTKIDVTLAKQPLKDEKPSNRQPTTGRPGQKSPASSPTRKPSSATNVEAPTKKPTQTNRSPARKSGTSPDRLATTEHSLETITKKTSVTEMEINNTIEYRRSVSREPSHAGRQPSSTETSPDRRPTPTTARRDHPKSPQRTGAKPSDLSPERKHVTTAKIMISPSAPMRGVSPTKKSPAAKQPADDRLARSKVTSTHSKQVDSTRKSSKSVINKSERDTDDVDDEIDRDQCSDIEPETDAPSGKKTPTRRTPPTGIDRKESCPASMFKTARNDKTVVSKAFTRSVSDQVMKTPTPTAGKPTSTKTVRPESTKSTPDTKRPSKHVSTKTINLSAKTFNSEDMENVIIDIQQAKSSREATPNRIIPTPASPDDDTGKPRFPDVVNEPDDEPPRRRPQVNNIPIFEEETNQFVGCRISEVHDEYVNEEEISTSSSIRRTSKKTIYTSDRDETSEVDECLMSVSDKVNKFTSSATKEPKQQPIDLTKKDSFRSNVTEKITKLTSIPNTANKKYSPTGNEPSELYRDDDDDEEPDNSDYERSPKAGRKNRPAYETAETDQTIEHDECMLSVSDKVSKFITTAEKLVATTPQRSPELVSKIQRQVSHKDIESEPIQTSADRAPKSSVADIYSPKSKPTIPSTPVTNLRSTDAVKKAKAVFERVSTESPKPVPKQRDILSRPSVFDQKRKAPLDEPEDNVHKQPPQPRDESHKSPSRRPSPKTETGRDSSPEMEPLRPKSSVDNSRPETKRHDTATRPESTPVGRAGHPRRVEHDDDFDTDSAHRPVDGHPARGHRPVDGHAPRTGGADQSRAPTRRPSGPDSDATPSYMRETVSSTENATRTSQTNVTRRQVDGDTTPRKYSHPQTNGDEPTQPRTRRPDTDNHELPSYMRNTIASSDHVNGRPRRPIDGDTTPEPVHSPSGRRPSRTADEDTPRTHRPTEQKSVPSYMRDTVSSRKDIFEKKITSTTKSDEQMQRGRPVDGDDDEPDRNQHSPSSIDDGGNTPSYMGHTKSSKEHVNVNRRDSVEITKTNYKKTTVVEELEQLKTEIPSVARDVQETRSVAQKVRKDTSAPLNVKKTPHGTPEANIAVEEIYDLEELESLLETVVSYDIRRRIRSQIRIVKRQLDLDGDNVRSVSPLCGKKVAKPNLTGVRSPSTSPTRLRQPVESDSDTGFHTNAITHVTTEKRMSTSSEYRTSSTTNVVRKSSRSPSPGTNSTKPKRTGPTTTTTPKMEQQVNGKNNNSTNVDGGGGGGSSGGSNKPIWATKNILKKASETTRSYQVKKTTDPKTVSRKQPKLIETSSESTAMDCVTSSYGIGPTDDDGKPLFGIRALKKKTTTAGQPNETSKVTGRIVQQTLYSENGRAPVGERIETNYSNNPDDLPSLELEHSNLGGGGGTVVVERDNTHKGISSVTRVQKIGNDYEEADNRALTENTSAQPKIGRRGSVKELSEKFIQKESASGEQQHQHHTSSSTQYPKAGLILRSQTGTGHSSGMSDSYHQSDSMEYDESDSDYQTTKTRRSGGETVITRTQTHTESGSGDESSHHRISSNSSKSSSKSSRVRSFLDNDDKVTGVQDILDRMRNADDVEVDGDTVEDREARSLLNKFLGASVLMSGIETIVPGSETTTVTTTQSGPSAGKQTITKRVTTKSSSAKSTGATPVRGQTYELDEIWDVDFLKELLDNSSNYEERRKIRARLRQVMADKEVSDDLMAKVAAELKRQQLANEEDDDDDEDADDDEDDEDEDEDEDDGDNDDDDDGDYEEVEEEETASGDTKNVAPNDGAPSNERSLKKSDSNNNSSSSGSLPSTLNVAPTLPSVVTIAQLPPAPAPVPATTAAVVAHTTQGESLLLPLLQNLLHRRTPQRLLVTGELHGASVHEPNPQHQHQYQQPHHLHHQHHPHHHPVEDSGTESGEDLKLLAAGLHDSMALHRGSNHTATSSALMLDEVTKALARLEMSLRDGRDLNMDLTKRSALLGLVSRLQTGLLSPDQPTVAAGGVAAANTTSADLSSPETGASNMNRRSSAGRFARRKSNRHNRHTVGVSREELADARRFMEEMLMMESMSGGQKPVADTAATPHAAYVLQKQNSVGSALGTTTAIGGATEPFTLFRPNEFVPRKLKGPEYNPDMMPQQQQQQQQARSGASPEMSLHSAPIVQMREKKPRYKLVRQSLSLDQPSSFIKQTAVTVGDTTFTIGMPINRRPLSESISLDLSVKRDEAIALRSIQDAVQRAAAAAASATAAVAKTKEQQPDDVSSDDNEDDRCAERTPDTATSGRLVLGKKDNPLADKNNYGQSVRVPAPPPVEVMAVRSRTPDDKSAKYANKKLKMKRANTINIPKQFQQSAIGTATAGYSSKYESDDDGVAKRNSMYGLKGTVQAKTNNAAGGAQIVPTFQPKTDNDRKFLAFIQKQATHNGLSWTNPNAHGMAPEKTANWHNTFGSIKNAFEKPPSQQQPFGSRQANATANSAMKFWKTADTTKPAATGTGTPAAPLELNKNVPKAPRLPWTEKPKLNGFGGDHIVTGSLRIQESAPKATVVKLAIPLPKPLPVNKFSHAPMSAFKPPPPKKLLPNTAFKPIEPDFVRSYAPISPKPILNGFGGERRTSVGQLEAKSSATATPPKLPAMAQSMPARAFVQHTFQPHAVPAPPKSPGLTLPWAGKAKEVDRRVLSIASSKFENSLAVAATDEAPPKPRSPANLYQSMRLKSNPFLASPAGIAIAEKRQSFAGLPPQSLFTGLTATTPPRKLSVTEPLPMATQLRPSPSPPPLLQPLVTYTCTDYTEPAMSTYATSPDVYPAKKDSLTNPDAEPIVLTAQRPIISPNKHPDLVGSQSSSSEPTSPDDDFSDSVEYMAVAKVMRGPVSQQAVTVAHNKPTHVGDDSPHSDKGSTAAKNLQSVLKNLAITKIPSPEKSPTLTLLQTHNQSQFRYPPKIIETPSTPLSPAVPSHVIYQHTGATSRQMPPQLTRPPQTMAAAAYNLSSSAIETGDDGQSILTSRFQIPVRGQYQNGGFSPNVNGGGGGVPLTANILSKSDSWHQICAAANGPLPRQTATAANTPMSANAAAAAEVISSRGGGGGLQRAKSGHSLLALPKQFEAGIAREQVHEKQKTVAAYFSSGKMSANVPATPQQPHAHTIQPFNASAINRKTTTSINRIKSSAKASVGNQNPSNGLCRSQTMPHMAFVNLNLLDETNVEDAFEDLFNAAMA